MTTCWAKPSRPSASSAIRPRCRCWCRRRMTHRNRRAQQEAVETLGDIDAPGVVDALTRIVVGAPGRDHPARGGRDARRSPRRCRGDGGARAHRARARSRGGPGRGDRDDRRSLGTVAASADPGAGRCPAGARGSGGRRSIRSATPWPRSTTRKHSTARNRPSSARSSTIPILTSATRRSTRSTSCRMNARFARCATSSRAIRMPAFAGKPRSTCASGANNHLQLCCSCRPSHKPARTSSPLLTTPPDAPSVRRVDRLAHPHGRTTCSKSCACYWRRLSWELLPSSLKRQQERFAAR